MNWVAGFVLMMNILIIDIDPGETIQYGNILPKARVTMDPKEAVIDH